MDPRKQTSRIPSLRERMENPEHIPCPQHEKLERKVSEAHALADEAHILAKETNDMMKKLYDAMVGNELGTEGILNRQDRLETENKEVKSRIDAVEGTIVRQKSWIAGATCVISSILVGLWELIKLKFSLHP